MISNKTTQEVVLSISKRIGKTATIEILKELKEVSGNKSFRDSIELLSLWADRLDDEGSNDERGNQI